MDPSPYGCGNGPRRPRLLAESIGGQKGCQGTRTSRNETVTFARLGGHSGSGAKRRGRDLHHRAVAVLALRAGELRAWAGQVVGHREDHQGLLALGQRHRVPVSYTHLTLQTIYSV